MLKLKKIGKILKWTVTILVTMLLLGLLAIFVTNKILSAKEKKMLEAKGYLNLVSVGNFDTCVNL